MGTETTLRDGSRVLVRPIAPTDRDAIVAGFAAMSPETRFRRFFSPVDELSERDLDYLTQVDHHDHEALVAEDVETGAGLGVARYVRLSPEEAEPAIVVVDAAQGRGLATVLLDALVARAREEGIRRFCAPVLASNTGAIHVLERLGDTRRRREGREVVLAIELPEAPPPPEHGIREALRHAASGTLAPATTLLQQAEGLTRRALGRQGVDDAPGG